MASRCWPLVLLAVAVAASSARADTDHYQGQWRLASPLGGLEGVWLLVHDASADAWRLELAVDQGDGLPPSADLQRRHGRGWTLCGLASDAFVQPWHGKWWQASPATADFLRELAMVARATGAPSRRLVIATWDDLPPSWRPPGREPPEGGRLRRQLVTRGLGRGGDGLVVTAAALAGGVRLTTTRWPVHIDIAPPAHRRGADLPAEAFLPLWPLADFDS